MRSQPWSDTTLATNVCAVLCQNLPRQRQNIHIGTRLYYVLGIWGVSQRHIGLRPTVYSTGVQIGAMTAKATGQHVYKNWTLNLVYPAMKFVSSTSFQTLVWLAWTDVSPTLTRLFWYCKASCLACRIITTIYFTCVMLFKIFKDTLRQFRRKSKKYQTRSSSKEHLSHSKSSSDEMS